MYYHNIGPMPPYWCNRKEHCQTLHRHACACAMYDDHNDVCWWYLSARVQLPLMKGNTILCHQLICHWKWSWKWSEIQNGKQGKKFWRKATHGYCPLAYKTQKQVCMQRYCSCSLVHKYVEILTRKLTSAALRTAPNSIHHCYTKLWCGFQCCTGFHVSIPTRTLFLCFVNQWAI